MLVVSGDAHTSGLKSMPGRIRSCVVRLCVDHSVHLRAPFRQVLAACAGLAACAAFSDVILIDANQTPTLGVESHDFCGNVMGYLSLQPLRWLRVAGQAFMGRRGNGQNGAVALSKDSNDETRINQSNRYDRMNTPREARMTKSECRQRI
jgi:hypothetical protein